MTTHRIKRTCHEGVTRVRGILVTAYHEGSRTWMDGGGGDVGGWPRPPAQATFPSRPERAFRVGRKVLSESARKCFPSRPDVGASPRSSDLIMPVERFDTEREREMISTRGSVTVDMSRQTESEVPGRAGPGRAGPGQAGPGRRRPCHITPSAEEKQCI